MNIKDISVNYNYSNNINDDLLYKVYLYKNKQYLVHTDNNNISIDISKEEDTKKSDVSITSSFDIVIEYEEITSETILELYNNIIYFIPEETGYYLISLSTKLDNCIYNMKIDEIENKNDGLYPIIEINKLYNINNVLPILEFKIKLEENKIYNFNASENVNFMLFNNISIIDIKNNKIYVPETKYYNFIIITNNNYNFNMIIKSYP